MDKTKDQQQEDVVILHDDKAIANTYEDKVVANTHEKPRLSAIFSVIFSGKKSRALLHYSTPPSQPLFERISQKKN